MKIDKLNRTKKNINKFSPKWIREYQKWIENGKPKEFTVYLLHDEKLGVKKIGRSSKIWSRVFNGLNHRYFYNFNLLDLKYFKNKQDFINFETKLKKFYKDKLVTVLTYALNKRKDEKSIKFPRNIKGVLANGGSENFKAEAIPNSFSKIEKEIKFKIKKIL